MRLEPPHAPLDRPRLYTFLDEAGAGEVVWMAAAGGYGKTTLAHSYPQARGLPLLKVVVPEWGITPGELFHALRQEAKASLGQACTDLPVLGPESMGSPERFAGSFGAVLGEKLNAPCVLLVDNLHHLPVGDPLHVLLQELVAAAGPHLRLVVASRHEPPADWARWRGQGRLILLDEGELAFTGEELEALLRGGSAGSTKGKIQAAARRLMELSGGWPAGVVLLLEHWRRKGTPEAERRPGHSLEALADWFRHEALAGLEEADRALLRELSLPALVPQPCVAEAAGAEDAVARLHGLCRAHAFIRLEEPVCGPPRFVIHDLFRDFLRGQAEALWAPAEYTRHCARWGRTLWDHGYWAEGADLLVEAGDQEGLGARLAEAAPELVGSGRGESLYVWLTALSEDFRLSNPELRLWEGMCLIVQDTRAARALLAEAWRALEREGALVPMAIAWTGIIDSIWLEWAHVSEYDPWIDAFRRHETDFRERLPAYLWFSVLRGILVATCHARPLDPALAELEREGLEVLQGEMPDSERLMLAGQLMYLNTWQFGRRAGAARIMALMADRQEAVANASPLARTLWKTFSALWAFLYEADPESCYTEAGVGRDLILAHGIGSWDSAVPPLHCATTFGDQDRFRDWLRWFQRSECKTNRAFYDTFQAHFMACDAWLAGDIHAAVEHGRQSLVAAERHGSVVIFAGFRALLAGCLAEAGETRQALAEATRARRLGGDFPSDFLKVMLFLPLARIPLLQGRPRRALPYLRRAFEAGERQRLFFPLMVRHRELATLCALALAEGIAPDHARWLIRTAGLPPPEEGALRRHWPWRIRLRTLGGLYLELEDTGETIGPRQKGAFLLSELVLAGPTGAPQATLAERVWPDSPPEKGLNNLHVALHRLREQLGDPEAVVVRDGQVALNEQRVWVDLWEFRRLSAKPEESSVHELRAAFDLFQGAPQLDIQESIRLEMEVAALEMDYQRIAVRLGEALEGTSPKEALEVYRRSLAHLDLHEDLCLGLLRCEATVNGGQGAKRAFQWLQGLYRRELEADPPASLVALYREIGTE
ncbi:MAG: BTAD domain-containing putative transcriptional regulator [Thiohalorhabdus sp.]